MNFPIFTPLNYRINHSLPAVYGDELSYYESEAALKSLINTIGEYYNGLTVDVNKREYSSAITIKRKLSADGDFTGTLKGKPLDGIFLDLQNASTLAVELMEMINNRVSIGIIIDGGLFSDLTTDTVYDGGLF